MDKTLAARLVVPNPQGAPTVHIFNANGTAPKTVLQLFDERVPLTIEHIREHWDRTDLCLFTSGGLTVARERTAARNGGGMPVILPAATDWCVTWIANRLATGKDVHIYLP